MSTFDFSNAAPQNDFDLIPAGTLAFGVLNIRPFGPPEDPNRWETPSQSSDAQYLDCELTISEGPYNKRKIFTKIGTRGSEKYVNMGRSSIRSILEVGRNASQANMAGYQIKNYGDLNGLLVAVEVKVEKGGQYKDKNEVQAWLTPNQESATHKKFQKLVEMKQAGYPRGNQATAPTQAAPAPAWASASPAPAAPPAPATQAPVNTSATNAPAWLAGN